MKKLAFILCMGLFPMFSFACSPGVGGGPSEIHTVWLPFWQMILTTTAP